MKTIAQTLVEQNIVRINFDKPFTWTSGIKSPIYCDCRELIGLPEPRDIIVQGYFDLMEAENITNSIVAGTATAGIPWAAFMAEKTQQPMIYVRKATKGHGANKLIEGRFEPQGNDNIVLIEDAFSTGGSSIRAAEAIENELEASVTHILGIFTWNTPIFKETATDSKFKLLALTDFDEIVEALLESEKINEDQKESLERFHQDPAGWSA